VSQVHSDARLPKVFLLAKSQGVVWLVGFGLFFLAIAGFVLFMLVSFGPPEAAIVVIPITVLCVVCASMLFVVGSWVPSMRYELSPEMLVMRCGPLKYNIPLAEVKRVVKTNLVLSLWSAVRLPGFALGTVPYAGTGNVVMCATRSLKDIILIETEKKKYGLTPRDETLFLTELNRYLEAKRPPGLPS